MIEVNELTKEFRIKKRKIRAVNGLSFEVKPGEILGLLGPNGAGKTTTIRLLSTLVAPTSGNAIVNGWSILASPERVRAALGVSLADERSFYYRLSGYQNLEFFGTLRDIPPRRLKSRILTLLEKVNLAEAKDIKFMKYSSGMKRKLSFCRALLADPPVCLLDEPTATLDPQSSREIREMILSLKEEGKTILLTTQNMQEAEQLCDKIAILKEGRLVVLSTAEELKRKLHICTVRLLLEDSPVFPADALRNEAFVEQITLQDGQCTIITTDKVKLLDILFTQVNGMTCMLKDVQITEPSLEDIFLAYVKGDRG